MSFYCYILYSKNKSYVGATINPARRIRQHNGIIKGGAKSTKRCNDWQYAALISGLPNKINMLQCEYAIKRNKGGINNRIKGLNTLIKQDKWTNNSTILTKDINLKITIADRFKHLIELDPALCTFTDNIVCENICGKTMPSPTLSVAI